MKPKKPIKKKKTRAGATAKKGGHGKGAAPEFVQVTDPGVIAEILAIMGPLRPGALSLPRGTKHAELYPKPVPGTWGSARLRRLLKDKCGVDDPGKRAFLFFNKAMDTLTLYFRDQDGEQTMSKKLERGGFILPASADDQTLIPIPAKKLTALFR